VNYHYKNLFDLSGKVAIVTGGLGILGRGFCRGLAEFGANVAVVDLDGEACAHFARELVDDTGAQVVGVGCDVANPESVKSMVGQVVDRLGGVHILHNNAASKSANLDAFSRRSSNIRSRNGGRSRPSTSMACFWSRRQRDSR
jgi:Dehydrogenases with different specificities (related to short-chain alcohol dehydrogenases)